MESIPEGMTFAGSSAPNPSTFSTWMNLLGTVTRSLDITSFYWTMTNEDTRTHEPSAAQVRIASIRHAAVQLRFWRLNPAAGCHFLAFPGFLIISGGFFDLKPDSGRANPGGTSPISPAWRRRPNCRQPPVFKIAAERSPSTGAEW